MSTETVVIVRCQRCMYERKRWDAEKISVVFVASTLKKYAEEQCEECGTIGMEIYVGEPGNIIVDAGPARIPAPTDDNM